MRKRQLLSILLIVVLLLSLLPASVAAEEEEDKTVTTEGLMVKKTATLSEDGTYTIQMEAYSTGTVTSVTKRNPTDIIIVMDVSGSMEDPDWGTDGEASWQQYNGWYTTAERLIESGQKFYCGGKHTRTEVELVKVENYYINGVGYRDLYGYYCSQCRALSSIYYNSGEYVSDYVYTSSDSEDCFIGNLNLYRNTSDITRMAALQSAVNAFIDTTAAENEGVAEEEQHRIAMVKFSGLIKSDAGTGNKFYKNAELENGKITTVYNTYESGCINLSQVLYDMSYVNSTSKENMKSQVSSLIPAGATLAQNGMYLANELLEKNKDSDREQIILFFTDGEPTSGVAFESAVANGAISFAKTAKETYGAKVYAVNMMPDGAFTADMTKYMNYVSSNYPSAQSMTTPGTAADTKYYKQVHDMADLGELFAEISSNISSTPVTLDGEAQIRDYMSESFDLPTGAKVVVQTAEYNGNNTWKTPVTVQEYPANPAYANSEIQIHMDTENDSVCVDGFSYKDNYTHEEYLSGLSLVPAGGKKLIVTVYGVQVKADAAQNAYIQTNKNTSGLYPDDSEDSLPVSTFPTPQVLVTSKVYVWDFGRPAFLSASDWQQTDISHLDSTGMNPFTTPVSSLDMDYGFAEISGTTANGFSYYPETMQWDGYDSVYVFGEDSENSGTNTWAKVSIIPANNVYYEDDFIAGSLNVEDGIVYTNGSKPEDMSDEEWAEMQSAWTATGEYNEGAENPNGSAHGWIDDLSEAAGYSDGAAHVVEAVSGQTNEELPSAKFTFTGTGMDIYSFTDSTTGTILVSVAKQGGNTQYYIVDNYAASGSYYQIPTVTFSGDPGTYDVTIYVTTAAASEERFTFYLDGIRVYNPLGSSYSEDSTVTDAYEGELNAVFTEVRNILSAGAVFIDKDAEGNTSVEMNYNDSDYALYAPEHEVYLEKDQSVTFAVEDGTSNYYVGLKALAGGATTAHIGNGDALAEVPVDHTTDLYYKVTPYQDSATGKYVITIKNDGENLLAITKVRQTSPTASTLSLSAITEEEALAYTAIFDSMEVQPYVAKSKAPQVVIEQPAQAVDEIAVLYEQLQRLIQKLFADLDDWF